MIALVVKCIAVGKLPCGERRRFDLPKEAILRPAVRKLFMSLRTHSVRQTALLQHSTTQAIAHCHYWTTGNIISIIEMQDNADNLILVAIDQRQSASLSSISDVTLRLPELSPPCSVFHHQSRYYQVLHLVLWLTHRESCPIP